MTTLKYVLFSQESSDDEFEVTRKKSKKSDNKKRRAAILDSGMHTSCVFTIVNLLVVMIC